MSDWEKCAEKVENEVEDILCNDKEACADFVTWLAEEKSVHMHDLVQEYIKTKAGADWLYHWTEQAYDDAQDPGEDGDR